jgi:hypothetical protein
MGWNKEDTPLADIAYFNSLVCRLIIRLYFYHVINQSYARGEKPELWDESA